eukprot:c30394_g1_i1 orf=185-391(-)
MWLESILPSLDLTGTLVLQNTYSIKDVLAENANALSIFPRLLYPLLQMPTDHYIDQPVGKKAYLNGLQ